MAVGEYVSVSSQRDLEHADLRREEWELENNWDGELEELTQIYEVPQRLHLLGLFTSMLIMP